MELESLDTCNICMELYSETLRPRVLHCGHNFCAVCLTNVIINGSPECPNCHKPLHASSAQDFPINYGMEALISEIRKVKPSSTTNPQSGGATRLLLDTTGQTGPPGGILHTAFCEQRETLRKEIQLGKEMRMDLQNYMDFLDQRKSKHEELIPQVYELAHKNERLVNKINTEQAGVKNILNKGEAHTNRAASSLSKSEEATGTKMISASADLEKWNKILEEWSSEVHKNLPSVNTFKTSQNLLRDTMAALSVISKEDEEYECITSDLAVSSIPIMDKLQRLSGECTLDISAMKAMPPNVASSLEKGQVYAIQEKEGQIRTAKMSLQDGKVYLHHLQDEEPPVYAHTIEHDSLIRVLNKDSTVAFLSLSHTKTYLGKVHILLSPDTPLAQNFRLRCTGELGPSYARSRFFSVRDESHPDRERFYGGEYANSVDCGNGPLVTGIEPKDSVYKREAVKGTVWSRFDMKYAPSSAQFGILTGSGNGKMYDGVFGLAQDGLNFLESKGYIRKLEVVDCGVVLPFGYP